MSRLTLVLLLLLGAAAFACSGNSSTNKNSSSGSTNTAAGNNQPNAGDSEQNQESSHLSCSRPYTTEDNPPKKAALEAVCDYALNYKQIPFRPVKVVVESKTEQTATVRVVGYSETCEDYCPGEIEKTYEVISAGYDRWKATDNFFPFEISQERKATFQQELQEKVD